MMRIRNPDPAYHFDADLDYNPAYHFDADPDPIFQFDADPDPQHWPYEVLLSIELGDRGCDAQKVQDDGRDNTDGEPQPRRSRRRLRH